MNGIIGTSITTLADANHEKQRSYAHTDIENSSGQP